MGILIRVKDCTGRTKFVNQDDVESIEDEDGYLKITYKSKCEEDPLAGWWKSVGKRRMDEVSDRLVKICKKKGNK